jgi:hypothetical protein
MSSDEFSDEDRSFEDSQMYEGGVAARPPPPGRVRIEFYRGYSSPKTRACD